MAIIGGLNNVSDVKILVLYILSYAGRPMSRENLVKTAMDAGSVEYFDLCQAIDELLMTGPIDVTSNDTPDILRITEAGRQTFAMFENSLPYNVRRKNQAALLKILADAERSHEVVSSVTEKPNGFEVVCTLVDGEDVLLEYKLLVPTQIQAQLIADQFKTDPTAKYKSILELLVDEKLFEDEF